MNVTLPPTSIVDTLAATLEADNADETTTVVVPETTVNPFESVIDTEMLYVPAAVGAQVRVRTLALTHPGGNPCHAILEDWPVPFVPVTVRVVVCPTSSADNVATGTVTVGSADTLRVTAALVRDAPFASVTVTVTDRFPAELGLHVTVPASPLEHPDGRPAHW